MSDFGSMTDAGLATSATRLRLEDELERLRVDYNALVLDCADFLRERDEALAENGRLRAERDRARALLAGEGFA